MLDKIILRLILRPKVLNRLARALLNQPVIFGDESRVSVAASAVLNNALLNVSSGHITIEDHVFLGHNVALLTGTHDYAHINEKRLSAIPAGGHDIIIRKGAWIASNVTIVGPVVIGEHAVVAAGAVVTENVAGSVIVGGVPARVIKSIDPV